MGSEALCRASSAQAVHAFSAHSQRRSAASNQCTTYMTAGASRLASLRSLGSREGLLPLNVLPKKASQKGGVVAQASAAGIAGVPAEENGASAFVEEKVREKVSKAKTVLEETEKLLERKKKIRKLKRVEMTIERIIFDTRFFALLAVLGSLTGALMCFFKGCYFVAESMREFSSLLWTKKHSGKVVLLLIEAVDVYLVGTVMLIFGMGLYELFVNELETVGPVGQRALCGSNLFGLFYLRERPKWLQINGLDDLKTKLGHVIVMILLVGMFEKAKKVPVNNGVDLLCFAGSILLSAGCLYVLNLLHADHSSHDNHATQRAH